MASRDIVCPCGNLLGRTSNMHGSGTMTCRACKRRVRYSASPDGVYTCYI